MSGANGPAKLSRRWTLLAVIAVLALGAAGLYTYQAFTRYQQRTTGASAAEVSQVLPAGDTIIVRNTATGTGYGMLATVSAADPDGARVLDQRACDRVYASGPVTSCLRTVRGVPTTFEMDMLDSQGKLVETAPLSGLPSRTRVSPGGLIATTAFVTGHSYATDGFSTQTEIRSSDGTDYGNLENYTLMVNGKELTAVDRNVWGVSFVDEDRFYATAASGGKTWLMKGSIKARAMSSVIQNAECPSVSPNKDKVAYKKRSPRLGPVHWDIAVLDLATGKETSIPLDDGFDDQLEWLDNDTLLFGQPRAGEVGDSDIYKVRAQKNAVPELFIEHAWSPSVQRTGR